MTDQMDDRLRPTTPTAHDHEAVQDDLAAYAIGAIDPTAAARVLAHLPTCPDCAAALREYTAVFALLPLGLPASQPPLQARDSLLDRARGVSAGVSADDPAPVARRRRSRGGWRRSPALRLALVAALLLIVTGGGVALSGEFGGGPLPYRRAVAMSGTAAAPDAAGMLVYGWERGELIVSGLPELPPDHGYQLWFAAPNQPWLSVSVFAVDPSGNAAVPIDLPENVRSFSTCDVTVEPAGGSSHPTGPHVLHGDWE